MAFLAAFAFSHDAFEALVLPGDDLLPGARVQVTRLIVRVRADYEPSVVATLFWRVGFVLHEVMQRKQLRELKQRVEGRTEAAWSA